MKKILCLIMVLVTLLFVVGCDDETPNGYKLASDPAVDGYTLYVPEAWYVTRTGNVITSNVSGLSTAAVTVARMERTHEKLLDCWYEAEKELKETVENYKLAQVPAGEAAYPRAVTVDGCPAVMVEYTGNFPTKTKRYRVRQYLISTADDIVVVTYSGCDEKKDTAKDTDFNTPLDYFVDLMNYFKPGKKGTGVADVGAVEDENTPQGMKNATLNEYIGMTVYLPEKWNVKISDGFIGATSEDGRATLAMAQINLTATAGGQETLTARLDKYDIRLYNEEQGFLLIDYWELLKKEYADYYDDGTFRVLDEPMPTTTVNQDGSLLIDYDRFTETEYTKYYTYRFSASHNDNQYEMTLFIFREKGGGDNVFRTMLYTTRAGEHATNNADLAKILAEVRYE